MERRFILYDPILLRENLASTGTIVVDDVEKPGQISISIIIFVIVGLLAMGCLLVLLRLLGKVKRLVNRSGDRIYLYKSMFILSATCLYNNIINTQHQRNQILR